MTTTKLRSLGAIAILSGALACASARSAPAAGPQAGAPATIHRDPVTGMELVRVAGGCYRMGADDDDCDATPEERPAHEVCVGDFYLGRYEVTHRQWKAVMGTDTTASSTCARDDCPADNVSFAEVQDFVARLNAARRPGGGGT